MERLRWVLGCGDREQRVRQRATPGGAAGCRGHAGRVGVDADHQRVGARGSGPQHVAAVTGAHVERDPDVTGGELAESADVELAEVASLDHAEHRLSVRQIQPRSLNVRYSPTLVASMSSSASG